MSSTALSSTLHAHEFYIDGAWVAPLGSDLIDVIDPSSEAVIAQVAMGNEADAVRAIEAAQRAFGEWSQSSRETRLALLQRVLAVYQRRAQEIADSLSAEMGAPLGMALANQTGSGAAHLQTMIEVLADYQFSHLQGSTQVVREAIGVVGMITPWNWPLNQIICKVAPALAAGCTMVLKPSEVAPLNALLFAEVMHEAGVPAGVFNLVNGDGPTVGECLARHPGVDMISITGSTRAGVLVAKAAADTVKRVHQELGGKSANIILDDADLASAVHQGVLECFDNSGQSCNAPTRMLVPMARLQDAIGFARAAAESVKVGAATAEGSDLGPVVSQVQFERIQRLIAAGIDEGAQLVAGGLGRPDGQSRGFFVRPTVFACERNDMSIVREEIFGPVLTLQGYDDEAHAIALCNDTPYGLAAYVQCADLARGRRIARQLRVGNVYINYPAWDTRAPFGGFKQSGNGREYGEYGLDDFLEIKGVVGYGAE
jgi:aldehyde dehydrogenase (NAD+)